MKAAEKRNLKSWQLERAQTFIDEMMGKAPEDRKGAVWGELLRALAECEAERGEKRIVVPGLSLGDAGGNGADST